MLGILVRLVPTGLAALIGETIILRFPFIGLLAMIALVPAEELTRLGTGRTVVWVLGVATFVAWLLRTLVERDKIRLAIVPTMLAVLWLLWSITSALWAQDQAVALNRALVLAQAIAFFALIQNLVTDKGRLKVLLFTYFISAAVCSLFAIGIQISTGTRRVSLEIGQNPAQFAEALGIGVLLVPYMLHWSKKFLWRLLLALGGVGIIVAVLLTGTRAVWVGLVGAIALTWFVSKGKAIKTRTLLIGAVILLVCFMVVVHFNIFSSFTVQRITTLPSLEATRGGAGRTNIWRVGWEMVKNNPIIGVGLQNFPGRFEDYIDGAGLRGAYAVYPGRDPHNIFLSIQSELGIIGLIIFTMFLVSVLRPLLRYNGGSITTVGTLLFFFLLVSGFAITLLYRKYAWFAIGIAVIIPMVMANEKD